MASLQKDTGVGGLDVQFGEYEIVKYRPEFRNQIVELQKHMWGPDLAINAAYLKWKYDCNPYMDTPLIYVALYRGKVVGMRGMFGTKWEVGLPSRTLLCLSPADVVVHPDHRRRGLFTQMTAAVLEDPAASRYAYIINLSSGGASSPGYLKMGWHSVGLEHAAYWQANRETDSGLVRGDASRLSLLSSTFRSVRRYGRQLPLIYSVYRRLRRYARQLPFSSSDKRPHPFGALDKNGARRRRSFSRHVSVEKAPQPVAMAELIERIGSYGRMRHVRDQQYFAWRFQNPMCLYRFLFWKDARLEGYLVLQTSVYPDRQTVNIVDWEATNSQVRADLLQAAIHSGNFYSLTFRSSILSDEVKTLLQETGFDLHDKTWPAELGWRHSVLVRPIRQEMSKTDWVVGNRRLLDFANWDLRAIYSDNF